MDCHPRSNHRSEPESPNRETLGGTHELSGKTAVITGGGGLLGLQHGHALASHGCAVVLLDINRERLEAATLQLRTEHPSTVAHYVVDITDEPALISVRREVIQRFGRVDILINNAARNPKIEDRIDVSKAFAPAWTLLEARSLLAGDLQITNVQFVDVDNNPIATPVVGEQVFLRTGWTAADLASSDSDYLRITDQTAGITPITLDSATFLRNAFGVETRSTVLGGWFAGLGQHHVEITIDYGNTVAETNEANNKILLNYVASTPDTLVQKFVQPLYGKQNEDFSIVHYVDLDPQPRRVRAALGVDSVLLTPLHERLLELPGQNH